MLRKAGKEEGTRNISDYRPVSLACSLYKAADTIVYRRLKAAFEVEDILPSYLYAYRKNFSLEDPALLLLSQIKNAKHLGGRLVWCQFDWSKAFTALDRGLKAHVARLINIPQNLVGNLLAMQYGVTAILSVHKEAQTTMDEIEMTSGFAQGLSSSCLFLSLGM